MGSFTQPGFAANHALITIIMNMTRQAGAKAWLELGAGIGNITLPLAATSQRVIAVENDRRAVVGLARSAEESGFTERIEIDIRNLHRADDLEILDHLRAADAVLADPPRSGLRSFGDRLTRVDSGNRPKHFFYVSCFAESLTRDAVKLYEVGYRLHKIQGLDQFPQSVHCEWVAWFVRE